jgi:hypothetical protein
MNNRITVNKEVNVTAVYFQSQGMKTFPRRMEFDGDTYTFADGLQYLIKKGQDMVQIFDMTDGAASYRLKRDGNHANWTLVAITPSGA